jgi:N-acetylmuramoyl-L-alanine amidase
MSADLGKSNLGGHRPPLQGVVVRSLLCLLVATLTAFNVTGQSTLRSHRVAGGSYVAVGELAGFYGLGKNLSTLSDHAEYRTSFASLTLQNARREIILDGVQHWLNEPAITARGQLWVTPLDVLKTIDPVFRQGRSHNTSTIRTVVLDPGHGGADRGTRGTTGVEKVLNLDTVKRLARYLEAGGIRVALTRTGDDTMALPERVEFAGRKKADLFVSVHFNSGGSADGIETYCVPPAGGASTASPSRETGERTPGNGFDVQNVWLAHCVQKSLLRSTSATDRGVRRARFYLLRYATCPAVLVECGFLSNRVEEQRILKPEYREQLAKAIAEGILFYKRAAERQ